MDNIRLYPGNIPSLEDEDNKNDNDVAKLDDDNIKPTPNDNEPSKLLPRPCSELGNCPQPKIHFDYKICLNNTKNDKEKWCERETGGIIAVKLNC